MKKSFALITLLFMFTSIFASGVRVDQRVRTATRFFEDWRTNNRADALKIASPGAVKKLFKTDGKDANWTFNGCNSLDCSYQYEGGGAIFHLEKIAGNRYKVKSVEFIAD